MGGSDQSNEQLARLERLRSDGLISDVEFEQLRARAHSSAGNPSAEKSASPNTPPATRTSFSAVLGSSWALIAGLATIVALSQAHFLVAGLLLLSGLIAIARLDEFTTKHMSIALSGVLRFVLAVGFFVAAAAIMVKEGPSPTELPSPDDVTVASNPSPTSGHTTPPLPKDEANFVSAVTNAIGAYKEAPNDMAKGGTRAARRDAICQVLQNAMSVTNWIGTIKTLSSNTDGKGVLEIAIAPDVSVGTWNNALSDVTDNTLLEATSPVFRAASALKEGDSVRFSGAFVPDVTDCIRETSMTLVGSMRSPEFIMQFSDLSSQLTTPAVPSPPTVVPPQVPPSPDQLSMSDQPPNTTPSPGAAGENAGPPDAGPNPTPETVPPTTSESTNPSATAAPTSLNASSAASFDCSTTQLEAERMICQTPALASLDERYNSRYRDVRVGLMREDPTRFVDVRDRARNFLTQRDACGASVDCITHAYSQMMSYLAQFP